MENLRSKQSVYESFWSKITRWAVALALGFSAVAAQSQPARPASGSPCDRACTTTIVDQILASMVSHDPDSLPLAPVYSATENSHPAALRMMVLWRTVTKADKPALLAIDTKAGQAYFALSISESGSLSAFWGRIKVVDRKITELEFFINRSRGDHGFSFSAEQMSKNYQKLMSPPPSRNRASREELERISRAAFDASDPIKVESAPDCQFSEAGSLVIDPGLDDLPASAARPGPKDAPLGCVFPPYRPSDPKAREIVIDEDLGIIVDAGVIPGTVYPYPFYGHMISAFIPNQMKEPQTAQDQWLERAVKAHKPALLSPMPASGETMQVLQYYDGKLQASQINVHLSGPGMHSPWVRE
jgi:hypothetical protein